MEQLERWTIMQYAIFNIGLPAAPLLPGAWGGGGGGGGRQVVQSMISLAI